MCIRDRVSTQSTWGMRMVETRFDLYQTISSVKSVIAKKFGSDESSQQLILKDNNNVVVANLDDDQRNLGFYCPANGYTIHVIDTNPNSLVNQLEDVSQVEKYVMLDEDYDKLPDNFRKWKKIMEEQKPEIFKKKDEITDDFQLDLAQKITVGQRCRLVELSHRGEVMFVGLIPEINKGYFVGVRLDEPYGKNDGSVKGIKYFDCNEKYGLFLRPDKIEVGDFPEIDPFEDEI
eukprot:TRINITY_DN2085_c0_g1_i5.p1 TRINITY_DN2085_c0_g1~~TRINITY_DN2085_c0_g1_i5.p1  ORF type:complete len:233 (-),score=57.07 TRINITY_DN2085_c0_g1_i5:100-798(-)